MGNKQKTITADDIIAWRYIPDKGKGGYPSFWVELYTEKGKILLSNDALEQICKIYKEAP